jgi:Signal transduction histidine kinase regulating C4-dicarboxylate transport system
MNTLSAEVEKREAELKELNLTLEKKVDERTFELKDVIEKLEQTREELLIKEKMASIGKLAGGIAHEMNNPLSAILAGVQMMKIDMKSGTNDDCMDNMEIIESAAKKTRDIVAKLQKYIDRGKSVITKFEVEDMIFKAVSMVEKEIKEEGIHIGIDIADGLEIKGNLVELSQVLVTILMNAKDAVVSKKLLMEKL